MRGEIPPNLGCNDPANLFVTDALPPLNVTYTCDNVAFIIACMEEQPTYLNATMFASVTVYDMSKMHSFLL